MRPSRGAPTEGEFTAKERALGRRLEGKGGGARAAAKLLKSKGGALRPKALASPTRKRQALERAGARFERYTTANVLGLYNARRDAGSYGVPSWQLALANGATSIGAPNGSSLGIATDAALRDTLACPYSCWAHANFQPAPSIRRLIGRASKQLSPSEPLTCAHLRTMWVDDHRCSPSPRGCQPVEFRRLVYCWFWSRYQQVRKVTRKVRDLIF